MEKKKKKKDGRMVTIRMKIYTREYCFRCPNLHIRVPSLLRLRLPDFVQNSLFATRLN